MTDQLDRAEQEIEYELAEELRIRKPPGPIARGICYYCGELVEPHQRWCGAGCEQGWEYERLRRQQNAAGTTG